MQAGCSAELARHYAALSTRGRILAEYLWVGGTGAAPLPARGPQTVLAAVVGRRRAFIREHLLGGMQTTGVEAWCRVLPQAPTCTASRACWTASRAPWRSCSHGTLMAARPGRRPQRAPRCICARARFTRTPSSVRAPALRRLPVQARRALRRRCPTRRPRRCTLAGGRAGGENILVLCDTYTPPTVESDTGAQAMQLHPSNNRAPCERVMRAAAASAPVFSCEQQYSLLESKSGRPIGARPAPR